MAYQTGPGHGAVGAYYHPPAPAHGRYPPPPPPAPAYGSVYPPAPLYGGGYPPAHAYGGYPLAPAYGGYHAPGYGPYTYTAPAAEPVQQHQNRPVISGIVAAGIEALAIGVFRAAVTNSLFGDGSGFNF